MRVICIVKFTEPYFVTSIVVQADSILGEQAVVTEHGICYLVDTCDVDLNNVPDCFVAQFVKVFWMVIRQADIVDQQAHIKTLDGVSGPLPRGVVSMSKIHDCVLGFNVVLEGNLVSNSS